MAVVKIVIVICVCLLCFDVTVGDVCDDLNHLGLASFVDLLNHLGLCTVLSSGKGRYTVFGFSDEIVQALVEQVPDDERLLEVMRFHVVRDEWPSHAWHNDMLLPTLLPGHNMRINKFLSINGTETALLATGSQIMVKDIQANNGVIHLLATAIYPLPWTNLLDTIEQSLTTPRSSLSATVFTQFVQKIPHLAKAFRYNAPLTLFIPVDSAFQKLPENQLEAILQDYPILTALLEYHAVNGTFYDTTIAASAQFRSQEGSMISVAESGTVKGSTHVLLNGISRILATYPATNGVAHIIDTVLIPPVNPKQVMYDKSNHGSMTFR